LKININTKQHVSAIHGFIFNNVLFNRVICEIMWKNMVQRDRPLMTIQRMCIAGWLPKATNTHSEHVIFFAFPLQQRLWERVSMLLYTYIASLSITWRQFI